MEPGNLVFGHSRGEYPVPRTDEYEQPMFKLMWSINPKGEPYGDDFENDVFEIHPYFWGECGCGFEELEARWDEQNKHTPECFHTLYRQEEERIHIQGIGFWEENNRMTAWAKANGYSDAPDGMAVHCTCDYQERWAKFVETHWHAPTCGVIRPNFRYKPTGYELMWYKHPLRDSFASQDLDTKQFREMMNACIASVKK